MESNRGSQNKPTELQTPDFSTKVLQNREKAVFPALYEHVEDVISHPMQKSIQDLKL
jgi:hypothetical protein